MVRILVIGGTGFIGRLVLPHLIEEGHDVTVFHRGAPDSSLPRGLTHVTGDRKHLRRYADSLRAAAPDVVIDMILSSGAQARELVDVFRDGPRRLVAISSMDVYRAVGVVHGLEPGDTEPLPLHEASRRRTVLQAYPREVLTTLQQTLGWLDEEYDKIPVEDAVLEERSFEGIVLRLPMVYGPGDPLRRFAGLLNEMDNHPDEIVYNAAEAEWRGTRGYVEDVARAIALAATRDPGTYRVFNVGEREALSELDWALLVARAARWSGRFVVLPADAPDDRHYRLRGNYAQHWIADTTRIREALGYEETLTREEAIRRTIAAYRTTSSALDGERHR
jgi:nucleoside-diphosphate-sugar epimerase